MNFVGTAMVFTLQTQLWGGISSIFLLSFFSTIVGAFNVP
jgi:uncharacterized membrane protein